MKRPSEGSSRNLSIDLNLLIALPFSKTASQMTAAPAPPPLSFPLLPLLGGGRKGLARSRMERMLGEHSVIAGGCLPEASMAPRAVPLIR